MPFIFHRYHCLSSHISLYILNPIGQQPIYTSPHLSQPAHGRPICNHTNISPTETPHFPRIFSSNESTNPCQALSLKNETLSRTRRPRITVTQLTPTNCSYCQNNLLQLASINDCDNHLDADPSPRTLPQTSALSKARKASLLNSSPKAFPRKSDTSM